MPEEGEEYDAKVKSIMPYGAFVEFLPGKQGLLHISEVSWKRLENLDGIMKEGDMVRVKLIGVDPKTGNLSTAATTGLIVGGVALVALLFFMSKRR